MEQLFRQKVHDLRNSSSDEKNNSRLWIRAFFYRKRHRTVLQRHHHFGLHDNCETAVVDAERGRELREVFKEEQDLGNCIRHHDNDNIWLVQEDHIKGSIAHILFARWERIWLRHKRGRIESLSLSINEKSTVHSYRV